MAVRRSKILFFSFLVLTVFLVIFSALMLIRVASRADGIAKNKSGDEYVYHIMMIGKRIDSPFWMEVFAGAKKAGAEKGAIIELIGPASDADKKNSDEYIDYAVAARVDGILAYIEDTESSQESLDYAKKKGVPVITLENDFTSTSRQSFVGVSSYDLGKILGALIHELVGDAGRAVVLLDGAKVKPSENIMLASIQESIQSYPSLQVSPIAFNESPDSSFEELIRQRIVRDENLDVIVCLNVEDTMRVAQAVTDLNRSGKISIIAFRESKDIFEYVRKGLVSAVVVIDANQLGKRAAESMLEFLETKHSNDYVITDMHVVTQKNVEKYLK